MIKNFLNIKFDPYFKYYTSIIISSDIIDTF